MNIPVFLKELAKVGVVALTEEAVKSFSETNIKPIFANWGKDDLRSAELEECLSEYLMRCYAKNNIMTTIVFGKQQKTLEDLYIPLTLEEYRNEDEKWIINENCYDILDGYSRILIVDMAGMGKSTVVKYFACQGINLNKSIPIVIELRKLEKNQAILEYIQNQINSLDKNIKIEEAVNILKKGDFVIFFDGYDEIANKNKPDVLDAIQEFTSKVSNTKIVITSREEDDLNALGEFKCVNIKPLTEQEAYKLIEKYDNDGEISKKLVKRLKEDSSMDVLKEFLENPLLVSLLYKTFEYKEEIPYKKIDFYGQVYTALFNDHDKTKGSAYVHEKKTKLDKYQFEQILRAFGFLALKTDKVEYSDQLIHHLLEQSIKRFSWLGIRTDDFLYDITHAVPFIQKDGNEYKWVHKSFMEYFASCFICYDNREAEEEYLKRMISSNNSMKYYNVLDFCYEMDTLGFRKYAILPYMEKYVDKYEKTFESDCFKLFGEEELHLAKQIVSVAENIRIIKFDLTNEEGDRKYKKYLSDILGNRIQTFGSSSIWEDEKNASIILFDAINPVLNKLLMEKMSKLFVTIKIEQDKYFNIEDNIEFCFNDEINNPINKDTELFTSILKRLVNTIFIRSNAIGELNYKKSKEIIEEIKAEREYQNNNFFDL